MSKYAPLTNYLRRSGQNRVAMTFGKIERIVAAKLPPSAIRHRSWWSNNPTNSVITHAWLEAGYETSNVDMAGRRLVFRKRPPGGLADAAPLPHGRRSAAEASGAASLAQAFGALRGTVKVAPGTDLTEPSGADWDAGR